MFTILLNEVLTNNFPVNSSLTQLLLLPKQIKINDFLVLYLTQWSVAKCYTPISSYVPVFS